MITVVLHEPQDLVNIAHVVRGMKNFGVRDLRLVNPRLFETPAANTIPVFGLDPEYVREIYGDDEACHPLSVPALAMTLAGGRLADEVGVRAAGRGILGKWLWLMRARWLVLLGAVLMKFGIRTGDTDWGRYKETLVRNADVRKFVDIYRQILAGTAAQRTVLDAWLQERYTRGELVYGLHVTDRALMTCLVFNYSGKHLHFIDGADGGLFLASKQFKERAARLAASR